VHTVSSLFYLFITSSLVGEAGIAQSMGWTTKGSISSPGRVKNFLFSASSRSVLGSAQAPIQRVLGALSPGVMRPGLEADHTPK
jgi:hypothetical protein